MIKANNLTQLKNSTLAKVRLIIFLIICQDKIQRFVNDKLENSKKNNTCPDNGGYSLSYNLDLSNLNLNKT